MVRIREAKEWPDKGIRLFPISFRLFEASVGQNCGDQNENFSKQPKS